MSLSPVIGTEVPETSNGVVTPAPSENGPYAPVSVKCGGSRVPFPGEATEHRAFGPTEHHEAVENKVYDGEACLETKAHNNKRKSSLSSHTSHVTDPSPPIATCTGDSDLGSKDTDISQAAPAAEPSAAALLWDSTQQAHSRDSSQRGGPATTYRQQTEAETEDDCSGSRDDKEEEEEEEEEDGEREKQDEEEDEKKEKKWIHQHAGGRTEVEVSALQDYFQLY